LKLKVFRIKTGYWKPGYNYLKDIYTRVKPLIQNGDIVTVSEKAIATAKGRIVDESNIRPGILAKFLSRFWMRKIWAGPLGYIVKLREKTLSNLRRYPCEAGAAHKETALRYTSFLQALRHYSEGGIDASNLPYSYVSLPLKNPQSEAKLIRKLFLKTGLKVSVFIVDGDSTFSWRNLHLAPRRVDTKGLVHFGGFLTFVLGRIMGFRSRATPIGISENKFNPDRALWFANLAHRISGPGAGRTVWDMSEGVGVDLMDVTWEMLTQFEHVPIVIIRVVE
jgi:F420-0:gamma-glutamyl ligase-like protein